MSSKGLIIILIILGITVVTGCDNSSRTPEFINKNEAPIPEGNRAEDSALYGRDTGSVNPVSPHDGGSQKATDSTSGSRIRSDGSDLENPPSPESKNIQQRLKNHENIGQKDSM